MGMETMTRMDGVELQTIREWLGLTGDQLAGLLGVNPRTVRSWEAGRDLIPSRVRDEVAQIEGFTAAAVAGLAETLDGNPIVVFRSDAELHAARPDLAAFPARWWRMVAARARQEAPTTVITAGEAGA